MTDIDQNAWFTAALNGDLAALRTMIVQGADVRLRDDQDRTAFDIASQQSNTDMMNTLLAANQMNYLRQIGLDPFAAPVQAPAAGANENRRAG